jgi:hypothetical protein
MKVGVDSIDLETGRNPSVWYTHGRRSRLYYYLFLSSRAARILWGRLANLRRIVNPPAGSEHNAGEWPEKFAACRYAGRDDILRPIADRPTAAPIRQAGCQPAAGWQPAPHPASDSTSMSHTQQAVPHRAQPTV